MGEPRRWLVDERCGYRHAAAAARLPESTFLAADEDGGEAAAGPSAAEMSVCEGDCCRRAARWSHLGIGRRGGTA